MKLDTANPDALTQLAQKLGWVPAGVYVTDLSVAGAGNMNRVLRALLSDGTTRIFKQALPFVARFPDIPAPLQRSHSEAAFYQALLHYPELLERTPQVLGCSAEHHLLCLQDLGEVGDFSYLYQLENNTGDSHDRALADLLSWLSKLHNVADPAILPDNRAMRDLNHQHLFVIPMADADGITLHPLLTAVATRLRQDDALQARIQHLGQLYLGEANISSSHSVLHGDYYPGSWVQHAEHGVMIIDPEFCFAGPAEFDIGVMWAHLVMCGYSEQHLQQIFTAYQPPAGFSAALAAQFAGVEIIRRIIGVAQLPLAADFSVQAQWLQRARDYLL